VHFAYRKRVCSEVGYGLRALGASLRIADRGGVFKGKGTVTAHFILQRELPTFHPPWISRASAPFFAFPPALQCMLVISHDYQCQVLIEVALVSVVREVRIVYVYKYENKIPVPD
jgi:hypothetical protein